MSNLDKRRKVNVMVLIQCDMSLSLRLHFSLDSSNGKMKGFLVPLKCVSII